MVSTDSLPNPSADRDLDPGDAAIALQRAALETSMAVLQRQRRLEQELQAANVRLESLVQDKVALLKEVNHRVKNNLQVVASLMRLEARRSEQPETRAVLGGMQARISSLAMLHETLYRTSSFSQIDLGAYLTQLCPQSFRAGLASHSAVRLELDLAPVEVSLDQAMPAGLLVNELISNALKHAFPAGRVGVVRVTLQAAEGGSWCLRVCDDGEGLPPDFDARREHSLGMQLVGDLAAQMGGTLHVPTPAEGRTLADFQIYFVSQI